MNSEIIGLLETLQEYAGHMAQLQNMLSDSFLDLALQRRKNDGLIIPDFAIDENLETRKLVLPELQLDSAPPLPSIAGVSVSGLEIVRNSFEKILEQVITIFKVKQQIEERYQLVDSLIHQHSTSNQ